MDSPPVKRISIQFRGFDDAWFERAYVEFQSKASNAIAVVTSDPAREQQTIFFLQSIFKEFLYLYDPWNGLQRWKIAPEPPRFEPVTIPPVEKVQEYVPALRNDLRDLDGALRHMDPILRGKKAGLAIRSVDPPNDQTRSVSLVNALRHWSLCADLTQRASMVCLITAQPESVLDPSTLGLTILARPELSSDGERAKMVDGFASHLGPGPLGADTRERLIAATRGLNLHQVRVALQASCERGRAFDVEEVKHWKSAIIERSDVVDIEEPAFGFDAVGGYEPVKRMVRDTLIRALGQPERARMAAMPLPRGLILFGPPGTGKTLFARAMARETNLPFINLRTENLFGPLLGQSGQRLRDAIELAEQASPAMVFVDEIDRFGRRQGAHADGASQETHRVFAQMLEWLGDPNRKSIVVGTTNDPENLDEAFTRPGRFSYCVPFLYPNRQARAEILRIHLGLTGGRPSPVMEDTRIPEAIDHIANYTKFYSGAELEEIVIRAKRIFFAGEEPSLTADHLIRAANDLIINTQQRQDTVTRHLELARSFGNTQDLLEALAQEE